MRERGVWKDVFTRMGVKEIRGKLAPHTSQNGGKGDGKYRFQLILNWRRTHGHPMKEFFLKRL